MKRFIAKYMLYVYLNFVKEEFDIYKRWALPLIYVTWFIRAIYIWIASVVFFPFFVIGMNMEEKMKLHSKEYEKAQAKFFELFNQ